MNRNVTALILLVLSVGLYFTYTKGQIAELQSIMATNAQYSSALDNAKKLISTRDQVLSQYNNISDADKARLDKIVPDNIDNVRLIIDISGIASRHGLVAQGITTSVDAKPSGSSSGGPPSPAHPAGPSGQLSTVTVGFSVTTTYQNFISLLQDLERSLRILDVTSITLSPSAGGNYTYGVTLNTYWLNQ